MIVSAKLQQKNDIGKKNCDFSCRLSFWAGNNIDLKKKKEKNATREGIGVLFERAIKLP